jgi:Tol biopolymer transport system component
MEASAVIRIRYLVVLAAALSVLQPSADAYVRPGMRTQVDLTTAGKLPAAGIVGTTSISGDGRFVAFDSDAPDLVPDDHNGAADVFVRDNATGKTTLITRGINGTPAVGVSTCVAKGICWGSPVRSLASGAPNPNYGAWDPTISQSGRYVAYASSDTNLVSGDTNAFVDVFVYDRVQATTVRVSLSSAGVQGNDSSWLPSISADGRYVSFTSEANNLVAGDTNNYPDVFVRDLRTGTTVRVSVSSTGGQACATFLACTNTTLGALLPYTHSYPVSSISGNGQFVEFSDQACGLESVDVTCGRHSTVYVHDVRRRTTAPVSVTSDGGAAHYPLSASTWDQIGAGSTLTGPNWTNTFAASSTISDDGRYAAFVSTADNLVPAPAANPLDVYPGLAIYVHDRATGRTSRVDVQSNGQPAVEHYAGSTHSDQPTSPALSADGRFVAMSCNNCEVVSPQAQIQVYDRVTGQLAPLATLAPGFRGGPAARWNGDWSASISADGRHLSCTTYWTPTGPTLPNWTGASDAFAVDRGDVLGVATTSSHGQLRLAGSLPVVAAANLVGISADGLLAASLVYRPVLRDVLIRLDLSPESVARGADPSRVYGVQLTVGGSRYEVRAMALRGTASTRSAFALYRQGRSGVWALTAELTGSLLQTGPTVSVALPLALIDGGAVATDVKAFVRPVWDDVDQVHLADAS